ncbi:MAG: rRNA maturation RNase YbeY [Candidatus Gracilibacteria bacterium]|nr:rRNA maturation RNase YbeY [Candidatus Gracilibacteria bacterium]MDD4530170.1 rRNA maturation RNase YbeY [Candidatus Gracilibacteria bacterium]
MFKFNLINKPKFLVIDSTIITEIFKLVNTLVDIKQKGILNLIFVSNEEIQALNKQYRHINKETDVLSFYYFDDFSNLKSSEVAGEIVFSSEKIKKQAKEFNNSNEEELYKLLVHSVLHIIGFDHETDEDYEFMKDKEDEVIIKINKKFLINIK